MAGNKLALSGYFVPTLATLAFRHGRTPEDNL